jgi:hypothetical protein
MFIPGHYQEDAEMHILHVEHDASPDYDTWKQAFDSDPLGRQQSGVRRYWVCAPSTTPTTS